MFSHVFVCTQGWGGGRVSLVPCGVGRYPMCPPPTEPQKRAVRILLECFLVLIIICVFSVKSSEGIGAEVYTDMLQKYITPYITTQV